MTLTIPEILRNPLYRNNPAILAPGRPPLSYQRLSVEIQNFAAVLHGLGLRRESPAALVLPNGPETAVAFLAVSSACSAAPLNPSYTETEFDYYFSDLGVEAVILLSGSHNAARTTAEKKGLPILEITPDMTKEAGVFTFTPQSDFNSEEPHTLPDPENIALLLHTSGTTSRPKIVPLTHANLCVSAKQIAESLVLSDTDRCLNIMPLFHIHGLIGCLLSTLWAGSSICCTEGFRSERFLDWAKECKSTWYSAVPSMHQTILKRAQDRVQDCDAAGFRFIRSSSAALPQKVKEQLEEVFYTDVIEAYGMTEASHQIAVNLPPDHRGKPGSVGRAFGTKIGILSEEGGLLPPNQLGEIVLQGPGISRGYLRNPEANRAAFTQDGWFRTGDQGYLDADGYLFITGRLKEIINRGGEKIIPAEVDRVLMEHPDVDQAVTFAMPHNQLGEEIAAAVVPKNDRLTEIELRQHARSLLADHKVPRKIIFLQQIPKGPTGKVQRIGLAQTLGLASRSVEIPKEDKKPESELEKRIAEIWETVLEIETIGINQDFLAIGGDSISAARIASRISEVLEIRFSIIEFFDANTIEKQAAWLEQRLIEEIEAMSDEEANRQLDSLLEDRQNE